MISIIWFIEVSVLLLVAKVFESLADRIGQPKVFAWVLVGLLIPLTGYALSQVTISLGILGIIIYLFYVGLEGSLRGFIKGLKDAGIIALGGVVSSLFLTLGVLMFLGINFREAFAVGVGLSATSVSITVKTLEDLGRINRREGQAILGAAVVDDVLGLALLSTLLGLSAGSLSELSLTVTEITILAFAAWFAVAYATRAEAKKMYRYFSRLGGEGSTLILTFATLLILAFTAEKLRLSSILLAYAFGLGLSTHTYIAHRVEQMLSPLIMLFTPLFFIVAGSRFSLSDFMSINLSESALIISVITALGFISKILGCYIPAKLLGFTRKESLIVGTGMVPRGEVMMTVALAGREAGLLSTQSYVSLVLLLPLTSLLVPLTLSKIYGSH